VVVLERRWLTSSQSAETETEMSSEVTETSKSTVKGETKGDAEDRVNFIVGDEVEEDDVSLESEDSTTEKLLNGRFHNNGPFMDASASDRETMEPTVGIERRKRLSWIHTFL